MNHYPLFDIPAYYAHQYENKDKARYIKVIEEMDIQGLDIFASTFMKETFLMESQEELQGQLQE